MCPSASPSVFQLEYLLESWLEFSLGWHSELKLVSELGSQLESLLEFPLELQSESWLACRLAYW